MLKSIYRSETLEAKLASINHIRKVILLPSNSNTHEIESRYTEKIKTKDGQSIEKEMMSIKDILGKMFVIVH